jgi:hypothetical protein
MWGKEFGAWVCKKAREACDAGWVGVWMGGWDASRPPHSSPNASTQPLHPPRAPPPPPAPRRSPIGGLGALKCVIQRDGPDSNKLPTSHTCFNTLLLPEYAGRDKMADRLRLAILNAEGFGLE